MLRGFAVAGAPGLSIPRSATSLVAFLLGAVVGGRLNQSMAAARRRRWLLMAGVSEAVLLRAAALPSMGFASAGEVPSGRVYAVIVLTAGAMGIRNESSLAGGDNPRTGRRLVSLAAMFAGAAVGAVLLRHGLALPRIVSAICVLAAATYAAASASSPPAANH